jgi:hypothetical protein
VPVGMIWLAIAAIRARLSDDDASTLPTYAHPAAFGVPSGSIAVRVDRRVSLSSPS